MMTNELISHIGDLIGMEILNIGRLSGGDVGRLYMINSSEGKYVLKMQSGENADSMLASEKEGLDFIHLTKTILTPQVLMLDRYDDSAFMLLENIDVKRPEVEDYISLGRQLANFHNCSGDQFGYSQDNFIGLLRQSNNAHSKWSEFYLHERILPQLRLAVDLGWLSPADVLREEKWDAIFDSLFPDIIPSPLHGDLWSGNFLIRKDGVPFLIDPSIYYGHSEVDLAMSKLFGGFAPEFYQAYQEVRKAAPGETERVELYQWYYLLVHLNMFGNSYKRPVVDILNKFL